MQYPRVLVVMPLYNARQYVRAAIKSILAQTYPNFSLLVINDGSTDGSEQIAASFQERGVILWNQQNQGPGSAMNRAIRYAREQKIPYLARMDADDISDPKRLEAQINLLEKYPAAAACSANCHYIHAETGKILSSSTISTSPALIRWEIRHGLHGLIQGASVFRTIALDAIGGYRMNFQRAEEVDVFLRLLDRYELRNCKEFLYSIRYHTDSYSLENVHKNIYYQFYALDCARARRQGKPEKSYETFIQQISLWTRLRILREEYLLRMWRSRLRKWNPGALILASLLDPRRVIIRVLRKFSERKQD